MKLTELCHKLTIKEQSLLYSHYRQTWERSGFKMEETRKELHKYVLKNYSHCQLAAWDFITQITQIKSPVAFTDLLNQAPKNLSAKGH